jgi:serine/threonine protein kinase HipA of HipAB toxin-antitoxin module
MSPNVTEIAADVFRISTFHPEFAIQFNQFLVADDEGKSQWSDFYNSTMLQASDPAAYQRFPTVSQDSNRL